MINFFPNIVLHYVKIKLDIIKQFTSTLEQTNMLAAEDTEKNKESDFFIGSNKRLAANESLALFDNTE